MYTGKKFVTTAVPCPISQAENRTTAARICPHSQNNITHNKKNIAILYDSCLTQQARG
jgi:hypothetical protein